MIGARESETLISSLLATITSSFGYVYQNFVHVFSLWSLGDHDVIDTTFELNCLKFKRFKLIPSWL
jgi:hypothetical protein